MAEPNNETMLVLISRVSELQLEQGKALTQQNKDQHEISQSLAVLNTRLEPLAAMATDFVALRLLVNDNTIKLRHHETCLTDVTKDVGTLKTTNAARGGWESVTSRLAMVLIGAAVAALVAYLVPSHSEGVTLPTPTHIPSP